MKTIKIMRRLMGCAAAILALTACSESEDLLAAYHSDSKAVHITAQVGKASADGFTRSNPLGATEADQAKFNENDEISVKADGQDAVTYQFNGSEWVPQGGKFLKWEKETMNFTAYYPASFDGNITQPTEYTSPESLAAADFMSFTGNVTNSGNNSLTLTMERKMARVVVEIADFNAQYTKNATVKSVTINGNIKAYKHSDNKFYALINPNSIPGATAPFLTLEVEDGTSKTTETLTTTPTFAAGNSYTYKLTVGKNKISVLGITVANWNTGTITDNGKAEQIIRYVTFTAEAEQKFKMTTNENYTISGLQYSVKNGKWQDVVANTEVTFGGEYGDLRLRGTNPNGTANGYGTYSTITFTKDAPVACTGDIRTLLDWNNYNKVETHYANFCYLFSGCSVLTSAPELPATTLAEDCYGRMFEGCTNLTTAPKLPAETLAEQCYEGMFMNCSNLTSAPELPAETLAINCYQNMFWGCTKLSTVTMLAPSDKITSIFAYMDWLDGAGTGANSRTLKVQDEDAYNALVTTGYLPENWKKGATNTTVQNKDGAEIK
jgi:hypothetical protein